MKLQGRQARVDALTLMLVLFVSWVVAIYFDLFELLHQFVISHEDLELDEIMVALLLLSFGMIWFARRRWIEFEASTQELLDSQQRLAEVQRLAHIGSWELNLTDNSLFWSDEVFRIFEINQDLFGASYEAFLETIHPDDRDRVNQAYSDSVENHQSYSIEHRLLLPDGRIKHIYEYGKTFYNEKDEPIRSVGTVQDISEIRELEQQLFQSQKMEAIGTLVGGIAHDFNNVLGAISGNVFLARHGANDPQVIEKLEAIEKLGDRAADMVRQLLTFARKDEVNLRPVELNQFIAESFRLAKSVIPENIRLRLELCKADLTVMGDATQLQQVLLNLLGNARDAVAGREDAEIGCLLAMRKLPAGLRNRIAGIQSEYYALIEVADNGHGMDASVLEKIFDPFFTTKDEGKGTGLGLAMVYGVIERCGGVIDVDSKVGKGSVFHIYLPLLNGVSVEGPSVPSQGVVSGSGQTVLVVDDEADMRQTIVDVLNSLGYSTLYATNGRQALEAFSGHDGPIDAVIMDMVMPEMGGFAAARAIREVKESIPIIFISGYDKKDELASGREMPVSAVLKKPFSVEQLSQLLTRLLGEKAA